MAIANTLNAVWRDLVHAGRSLAKARAFTLVCVVTLGVGMTPIIAIQYAARIFTTPPRMVNGHEPTELVEFVTTPVGPKRGTSEWSYPDFVDLSKVETGVSITGWSVADTVATLPDSHAKTSVQTMFVSSNYFRTIGVALARGPGFVAPDTTNAIVILSHMFWQKRLAAEPEIVGKTLTVDGVPHVVVGVAPETFSGHLAQHDAELFLPLDRHPNLLGAQSARFDRGKPFVNIHGRLSPGVSVAQASAAVGAFTAQLAKEYSATNESRAGIVVQYYPGGSLANTESQILYAILNAVATVPLLVVCLNVSSMVLVRSAMRERELSIRLALGASRTRLVRHLLAEAVVLAGLGGMLASVALINIPPLVAWWIGTPLPLRMQTALRVDAGTLAISAGLCLATSLVFGLLPALRFSRAAIMTVLKDEAGTSGIRAGLIHRVTSALQVAVAVPLLVLSFMQVERMRATASADLGFDAELIYAAPLKLETAAGENAEFLIRKVRAGLTQAAGVTSVTVADGMPLDYRFRTARVSTEASTPPAAPKVVSTTVTRVGDGYLETMGIAILRGRGFRADDADGTPMVTVISKALAAALFPDREAVNQRLTFEASIDGNPTTHTLTVVGITADFPTSQMSTDREQLLLPMAQHPNVRGNSVFVYEDVPLTPTVMLIVRSAAGEPSAKLTAALENAMRDVDPDFEPASIQTGVALRKQSMDDFLNHAGLAAIGGTVTLLLAAMGIYGVVGLMVSRRTREIAVRMTLGASRRRVVAMILFDVVKFVAPGVALGVLGTIALVRIQGGITVSTVEPVAYVAGAAIAILTAVAASVVPARRAASVEPVVAMRST
jgi:predicted permease